MRKHIVTSRKTYIINISLFVLSFIFINVFVSCFMQKEKYIYFWDYYGYWEKYQYTTSLFVHHPFKALLELLHSVRHDDYNLLPVFFLFPYYVLLGPGRIAYILAIAGAYVFPAAVLAAFFVQKFSHTSNKSEISIPLGITLATFLFFPQYWVPVFCGYPDAVGVVVIFLIFHRLMNRPIEEQRIWDLLLLGILLAFLILLRRWYAYWVIAFFIAIAAERLLTLFPLFYFHGKKYLPTARNLLVTGTTSVAVFFIVAGPIAVKMIGTDYADVYSAYKWAGSIAVFFYQLYDHFGLFISTLCVLSLISGIYARTTRNLSIFLFFHFLSVTLLFSRVQDFGVQHFYLIMPSMILLTSIFVARVFIYLKGTPLKTILLTSYICLSLCQLSVMFSQKAADYFIRVAPLFSSYKHYPLVRNDLQEMHNLLNVLTPHIEDGAGSSYVLASSTILNDAILKNACLEFAFSKTVCDSILTSHHIDKRDGFPKQFLSAAYVIVAKPIQYHLRPEDQRVVGIFAEDILGTKGIGTSLKRLPYEFTLDDNIKVYIYKKVSPYKEPDLHALEKRFLSYYPGRQDLFKLGDQPQASPCEMLDKSPENAKKTTPVNFENKIKLLGFTATNPTQNQLNISYYWQVLSDFGQFNNVFVHFTDENNNVLTQNDHVLCQGKPFAEMKGKFIKETYMVPIPPSIASKKISIKVGLYNINDPKGPRLKIMNAGNTYVDDGGTRALVEKLMF